MKLVVRVASKQKKSKSYFAEFVQEGAMGLMRAIEKFDPAKHAKLSTYSYYLINQYMQRFAENNSRTIRIPANKIVLSQRMKKEKFLLERDLDREVSIEELAEKMGIEKGLALKTWDAINLSISTLDITPEGHDKSLVSFVADKNCTCPLEKAASGEMQQKVNNALSTLPERTGEVLRLLFGIGMDPKTVSDLSQELGVTRQRIDQLMRRGFKELRRKAPELENYLKEEEVEVDNAKELAKKWIAELNIRRGKGYRFLSGHHGNTVKGILKRHNGEGPALFTKEDLAKLKHIVLSSYDPEGNPKIILDPKLNIPEMDKACSVDMDKAIESPGQILFPLGKVLAGTMIIPVNDLPILTVSYSTFVLRDDKGDVVANVTIQKNLAEFESPHKLGIPMTKAILVKLEELQKI
jgi:RNA polymerase sigma factor (sigma-70 family)